MRSSARTGMAVAVAGVASGLTMLSGGATALAATTTAPPTRLADDGICRYEVIARHGLKVHETPRGKEIPPPLKFGKRVLADCKTSHDGWVELRGDVPVSQRHGWVFAKFLKRIKPVGGVSAGGGGTSAAANPMLAGAGIGALVLGAGVAVSARRRQVRNVA
ncbi:hypothetical protein [Actinomadura decatromicini]|uniref:SH3 domain-containing protein n=1 Tax=Actinomadura decatromicini TaxID=2604572 RepID=A0A5D3FF26_9ACTN|nr:hypothetical protein [Actinomadura decatromicini]TYK46699.1 hypothetical protein FXF68_22865 [Actinomadura decatromicini]